MLMSGDRGHLRTMRLLPFSAAATNRLTFSMQTRRIAVDRGRWRRSEIFSGHMGSMTCGAVAALCCCTLSSPERRNSGRASKVGGGDGAVDMSDDGTPRGADRSRGGDRLAVRGEGI